MIDKENALESILAPGQSVDSDIIWLEMESVV